MERENIFFSLKQSLGFGFEKFGIGKKVSVLILVKILVSSFSASYCVKCSCEKLRYGVDMAKMRVMVLRKAGSQA